MECVHFYTIGIVTDFQGAGVPMRVFWEGTSSALARNTERHFIALIIKQYADGVKVKTGISYSSDDTF